MFRAVIHKFLFFIETILPNQARFFIFVTATLIFCGLAGVAYFALEAFGPVMAQSDKIGNDRSLVRGGRMTSELFDKMLDAKLLELNPDTFRFDVHIDCSAWSNDLNNYTNNKDILPGTLKNIPRSIAAQYCKTDLGRNIKSEIEQWNSSQTIVAVRDTRSIGNNCDDETPVGVFIRNGCYSNDWAASWRDDIPTDLLHPHQSDISETASLPEEKISRDLEGLPIPPQRPSHAPFESIVQNSAETDQVRETALLETIQIVSSQGPMPFATVQSKGAPNPEVYGFLARDLVPGFGDWRQFSGLAGRDEVLELTTTINPRSGRGRTRKISVDVVGEVVAAWFQHENSAEPIVERNNVTFCEKFRRSGNCQNKVFKLHPDAPIPRAHRISFDLPVTWQGKLSILVRPNIGLHARVRAMVAPRKDSQKAEFEPPSSTDRVLSTAGETIRFTTHIVAHCRHISPEDIVIPTLGADGEEARTADTDTLSKKPTVPVCTFSWLPSAASQPQERIVEPGPVIIKTSGQQPIELSQPRPTEDLSFGDFRRTRSMATEQAFALGLIPIIGVDDTDPKGLLGQLRTKPGVNTPYFVALSIDAEIQRTVFGELTALTKNEGRYTGIGRRLKPDRDLYRHANIVLVDAGPVDADQSGGDPPGRILAAATWPQLQTRTKAVSEQETAGVGLSEWDLRATETFEPTESRLATRAWSQSNRLYAPGSSFKILVSLAAIEKAARSTLQRDNVIAGYLGASSRYPRYDRAQVRRFIGPDYDFSFDASEIQVPLIRADTTQQMMTIGNRGAQICSHILKGGCKSGQLNLVDMLARSDNLYFSRLALLLDDDAVADRFVGTPGQKSRWSRKGARLPNNDGSDDMVLAATAARLWPVKDIDLLPGEDIGPYSRLTVSPISLDSERQSGPRLFRLALNGIGQAAQATPLAMANIAASIANGKVMIPRLGGVPGTISERPLFETGRVNFDARLAAEMLGNLRIGMKAVIQRGTAAPAFSGADASLRKRIWGKTGTAQTGFEAADGNTAWFVGWLDGLDYPGYEKRRIAFACMISHIETEDAGGGSVCAPLMRSIFEKIELPAALAAPPIEDGP